MMTIKEFEIQYALGSLSSGMKYKLAINTNNTKMLKILSTDKDQHTRGCVGSNPNTPEEILIKLSKDKKWWTRWYVTMNPNTPKEILNILSKDSNGTVRWGVYHCNPSTSKDYDC